MPEKPSTFYVLCSTFLLLFLKANFLYAKYSPPQGPFSIRTQHPVYLQTVNLSPARAQVLLPGVVELKTETAYSNLYERESSATSDVHLDMELLRWNWMVNFGVFPAFEVGLELPFFYFNGGFLDAFIQNFHNFFGFPNGGRDQVANGSFQYRVSRSGQVVYQISSQALNVGDLTLFTKHQFLEEGEWTPMTAWRFAFKLPSGDPDKGLGSGNVGFGLGLAMEKSYQRWHSFLNLNYLIESGNESLEGLMAQHYFDFSWAGEFSFSKRISAIVQLVGGTPRLKGTGLEAWDGVPLDLIVGARGDIPWGGLASPFFWQAGFSEDVTAIGPSVDFTTWVSLGVRFPIGKERFYQGDFFANYSQ